MKHLRFVILLFIILFIAMDAHAQQTISGAIVRSNTLPVSSLKSTGSPSSSSVPSYNDGSTFGWINPITSLSGPPGVTWSMGSGSWSSEPAYDVLWNGTSSSSAPTWSNISLTGDVSGILPSTEVTGLFGVSIAPASGQILIGNLGGTAYAPKTMSGGATITPAGIVTLVMPTAVTDAGYRHLAFQFANGGSALTTGLSDTTAILYTPGTIVAVYLTSPDSTNGSATVDIVRSNASVPTSSNSIIGSGTKPSISSTTYGLDTTFTSWTSTNFSANDVIEINLTSVTTLKYLTVELVIQTT